MENYILVRENNKNTGPNVQYVVYCCALDDKPIYVGITKALIRNRIYQHHSKVRSGLNRKFYNKIRNKLERCKWYIVGHNSDYQELKRMETEFIQLFNTFYLDNPEGCNLTLGGDEGGNTPSDENIAKFRKRMDDYWN